VLRIGGGLSALAEGDFLQGNQRFGRAAQHGLQASDDVALHLHA
jgi:hypothetical protein